MSKNFKTQDHFRYKRLGKRWRRPVGWQSKLRLKRGGSGRKVSVGYGTRKEGELDEIVMVRNVNDVIMAKSRPVRIASSVGAKNVLAIAQKAKELDSRIVNANKVKRAKRMLKSIADRKVKKKKEEEKKKAEEKAAKEKQKHEKAESKEKKAETKTATKTEQKETEETKPSVADTERKESENRSQVKMK
jgi:ribosomal protein L32E